MTTELVVSIIQSQLKQLWSFKSPMFRVCSGALRTTRIPLWVSSVIQEKVQVPKRSFYPFSQMGVIANGGAVAVNAVGAPRMQRRLQGFPQLEESRTTSDSGQGAAVCLKTIEVSIRTFFVPGDGTFETNSSRFQGTAHVSRDFE